MTLPFTTTEFFDVFEKYNTTIWPGQAMLYAMASVALIALIRGKSQSGRVILFTLALLWLWMGVIYHFIFFSEINKASYVFGLLFVIQAFIFLYLGISKKQMDFRFKLDIAGILGSVLLVYALVAYPILGRLAGHIYPRSPTFGVPCPTTIFTFGLLLFTPYRTPWYWIVVPLLWSAIGFSAAMNLSVREDLGLVIAGISASLILIFFKPVPGSASRSNT